MDKIFRCIFILNLFSAMISLKTQESTRKLLKKLERQLSSERKSQNNDVNVENAIRLDQTQKVIKEVKDLLKKGRRKLVSTNASGKKVPRKTLGDFGGNIIDFLDKQLNFIPRQIGVDNSKKADKAFSLIGQGLLVNGILKRKKWNEEHVKIVKELTTKLRARELYISSIDRNRQQLQIIGERLSSQPDYFNEKKSNMDKFFNNLINYSE